MGNPLRGIMRDVESRNGRVYARVSIGKIQSEKLYTWEGAKLWLKGVIEQLSYDAEGNGEYNLVIAIQEDK